MVGKQILEHLRHAKTDSDTFPMLKNHLDKPHRLTCSINPSEKKNKNTKTIRLAWPGVKNTNIKFWIHLCMKFWGPQEDVPPKFITCYHPLKGGGGSGAILVKLQTSVQSRCSTFVGVSNLFVIHFPEIGNLEPQAIICQIKSNLSFWLCKMPFFILLQQYSTRRMSKKGQVQEKSTH